MRWFLGIVFFSVLFGSLPAGEDVHYYSYSQQPASDFRSELLDVFQIDLSEFINPEARLRNTSTTSQRIKNDRVFEILEFPGLVFLTCKIAKAYSEVQIHQYLKFLFQYTIQVNAP